MIKKALLNLRMYGAIDALEALGRIDEKEAFATALLEAELDYREQKKTANRLRVAMFPVDKNWEEIDKSLNPNIDFNAVKMLGNGDFVCKRENVCLVGHQGTGKSHSMIALGKELCRNGFSVKFCTAQSLITSLVEAQDSNKLGKMMKALLKPSALFIDEMGFLPFTERGANLLFEIFANRYERGSIIVSTNLSFDKWVNLFKSVEMTAALLDRFTHNIHVFVYAGQSVRTLKSTGQQKMQ